MKNLITPIAAVMLCLNSSAQEDSVSFMGYEDTFQYERFLEIVEQSLFEHYKEVWGKERAYEVIDSMGYEETDRPTYSDSVYIARLNKLDRETVIDIEANDDMLTVLKYFVRKRRKFTALCLGRSKLFFPMYEEYLDKYDIPIELKYLSVIESGLRPTAKSRAGASGLWQFMYRTGRMYGLHTDSYVDERLNPEMATDAACRYLKYLHGMYGDWSIALAAYNAGPGNVNKAIRRSGGQMNYWKLRSYLPRETQMYVPNFIAMVYMMNYYPEHNIVPVEPKIYNHEVDTVCLTQTVRISYMDSLIGLSDEDFRYLNPTYKTDIIPQTEHPQCITLPVELISVFLEKEEQIYGYEKWLDTMRMALITLEKKKYHYVKPGESMAMIAEEYDVMVSDIKKWNGLRYTRVYPNQQLVIMVKEQKYVAQDEASTVKTTSSSNNSSNRKVSYSYDGKYKYYTLRSGESLWTVSQKLGIPFGRIQELNRDLDPKRMQPGDKIRIEKI
ncbi:MAG: transglycosylase SLT domain-containing protein [Crocinitomicaceae bacterium]|nr:transglycosylase SLT domain-containing protein [Crocinitomicaceae bacterium]